MSYSCALKELESLKDLYGAKLILQRYQVRNCKHFKNPVSASECLHSMLEGTNSHHYFVATQVSVMSYLYLPGSNNGPVSLLRPGMHATLTAKLL